MLEYDPIQIVVMAIAGVVVSVVIVALFRSIRKATSSRRHEERLAKAFDRASYIRQHGSVPVGSQYGIYEDKVRSISGTR